MSTAARTLKPRTIANPVVPMPPPDPDPEPPRPEAPPPPWHATFPGGGLSEQPPRAYDPEALELARGDRPGLAAELAAGVVEHDRRLAAAAAELLAGADAGTGLPLATRLAADREHWAATLARVDPDALPARGGPDLLALMSAAALGADVARRAAEEAGRAEAELREIEAGIVAVRAQLRDDRLFWRASQPRGNRGADWVHSVLTPLKAMVETFRSRVDPTELWAFSKALAEMSAAKAPAMAYPPKAPLDALLGELSELVRRRRSLVSRRDALRGSSAAATEATAGRVRAAVEAGGGLDVLVASVVTAERLTGCMPPALEALVRDAQDAAGEYARVEAQADELTRALVASGPAARTVEADLAAARARLAEAESRRDAAHRASALALIEGAQAGDEPLRESLERLARDQARYFPDGFAEALARAGHRRALLMELASALAGKDHS